MVADKRLECGELIGWPFISFNRTVRAESY